MAKRKIYRIYRVLATKLKDVGQTNADNRKDVVRVVKMVQPKGTYIAIPKKTFLKARDMIVIKK